MIATDVVPPPNPSGGSHGSGIPRIPSCRTRFRNDAQRTLIALGGLVHIRLSVVAIVVSSDSNHQATEDHPQPAAVRPQFSPPTPSAPTPVPEQGQVRDPGALRSGTAVHGHVRQPRTGNRDLGQPGPAL